MISLGQMVPFPPENRASEGGGPIRRNSPPLVNSGWQMPSRGGSPTMVHRTPKGAVPEHHPGYAWPQDLTKYKFLPDGRLRPADALGAPPEQIAAGDAVARLQNWYGILTRAGGMILNSYKALGRSIPCEVRARHNAAVAEYLRTAQSVFAQLAKQGIVPVQKLLDVNGAPLKELQISTPVAPLTFITTDCKIAGVTPLEPAASALGVGFVAVVIAGAVAIAIVLIGNAAAKRISWIGTDPGQVQAYQASVDAHAKCVRDALAAGAKPDDVVKICPAPAGAKPPSTGLGFWGAAGLVAGLAAAGAGAYYFLRRA